MLPAISGVHAPLTIETWENSRKEEILCLFEKHVYGITPKGNDHIAKHALSEVALSSDGKTSIYVLTTTISKGALQCEFTTDIYVPVNATEPMPVVIMTDTFSKNTQIPRSEVHLHAQMPYDMINEAGIIGVHAHVDALCLDDADHFQKGLLEIYPRQGDSGWGAIGVWAWAVSRVVDFLVEWPKVNPAHIGICGCSRAGKTALWCSAQDDRISLTISNVSGCTGAAITRGKTGEHIKDITSQFPHWMCEKYASYQDCEESLPVDQHMLLALCAPNPLYVSSASEDTWADPQKEFESAVLAGEIHRLYGKEGLEVEAFPPIDTPLLKGDVAYHNRKGSHGCTEYDWEQYIKFMKKYFI